VSKNGTVKPSCVAAASYPIPIMAMFPEFYVMKEWTLHYSNFT
jgi:hypothetical protein